MADNKIRLNIPLEGRCNNSDNPATIGTNFRSLKNLRYMNKGLRAVSGMTKINTTPLSTTPGTYLKVRSAHHFRKEQPSETHLLAQAWNMGEDASRVIQNTTAIPSQGNFSGTVLMSESTGAGKGRFSDAPNGHVAYCNGVDTAIWGGDEFKVSKVINYELSAIYGGKHYDYTEQLQNTLSDTANQAILRYVSGMIPISYLYIGSIMPLKGIKFYVATANTQTSTTTITYWNGSTYAAVSGFADGTAVGGKSLAQTGSMTFTDTSATAKLSFLNGVMLYWYKVAISHIDDGVTSLYYMTLNSAFQTIKDVWDGELRTIGSCMRYNNATSTYKDNTVKVATDNYESTNTATYAAFDIASANPFYMGFPEPMCGISVAFADDWSNETALTITVYYWNGSAWTAVTGTTDGTLDGSISFAKSGFITWSPIATGSEFKTTVGNNVGLLYYYKIVFSGNSANDMRLYYVGGIPSPKNIRGYSFPMFDGERLWLCSNKDGDKNSVMCSMLNAPNVFNGEDSATIYFGDESELTAATSVYMRLGNEMHAIKLFFKKTEVWSVTGASPEKFVKRQVSQKYGCIAPLTLVTANALVGGIPKIVVIWQGSDGLYMFDQTSIIPISDDIRSFFDKNATTKLNTSKIDDSVGFYDPEKNEYHWLFATGDSSSLNNEWVYDLFKGKWFEIDRGTYKDIQFACPVMDTYGNQYVYGFIDPLLNSLGGYMERLEYGTTFDGNDIAMEMHFGNFQLIESAMYRTKITKVKLIGAAKITTAQKVLMSHYGDGATAISQTDFQNTSQNSGYSLFMPISRYNHHEHTFHSLKFTISTNDETYGFEPLAIGILGEVVREDLEGGLAVTYLVDEAGNYITDEEGNRIIVDI